MRARWVAVVFVVACGTKSKPESSPAGSGATAGSAATGSAAISPGSAAPPGAAAGSGSADTPTARADLLARAATCTADADCVHLGDACGFGCAVTVNKQHEAEVNAAIRATPQDKCAMDCPPVGPPACASGKCVSTDRSAAGSGSAPAPAAAGGTGMCKTAADCGLSCYANSNDCCGDACGCKHAMPKTEIPKLEAEQRKHCANRDPDCPQVRCIVQTYVADCQAGRCVTVIKP